MFISIIFVEHLVCVFTIQMGVVGFKWEHHIECINDFLFMTESNLSRCGIWMVVERDILCLEVFSILLWKYGEPNPNGWVRDATVRAEKAKVEKGLWADIDQNHPLFFPYHLNPPPAISFMLHVVVHAPLPSHLILIHSFILLGQYKLSFISWS